MTKYCSGNSMCSVKVYAYKAFLLKEKLSLSERYPQPIFSSINQIQLHACNKEIFFSELFLLSYSII